MRMTKNWTVFKNHTVYAFISPNALIEHIGIQYTNEYCIYKNHSLVSLHISELTPSNGWVKVNVQKMSQANLAKGILE